MNTSTQTTIYQPQVHEKYMSKEQLNHFLNMLIKWRESLQRELQSTLDELRNQEILTEVLEQAKTEESLRFRLHSRNRESKLIRKIEKAIARIHNNQGYGYCMECKDEIGLARLEARPTAEMCFDCKSWAELKEEK